MVYSMTGFGRGSAQSERWVLDIQLRAVNHRFCEVVVRLPKSYVTLEEKVRRFVLDRISRGRVEVFIAIEPGASRKKSISADKELAAAYVSALGELSRTLGLDGAVDIALVAKFPDVLALSEPEEDLEALWEEMQPPLEQAVEAMRRMREQEGAALGRDLIHRTEKIGQIIKTIEARAPQVVEEYRERLKGRISELLGDVTVDENRLLLEVAVFADKSSITEELTRLHSHLEQMTRTLEQEAEVGRKLDFMIQEINREINTIGSKASDFAIATAVVEAKSELEKIREQIQNLE